jgi:hypothetical protein
MLSWLGRRIQEEPVLFGAAVRASLLAAMAFGVKMTMVQLTASMVAVEAILAFATRKASTPNTSLPAGVAAQIADAKLAKLAGG